MAPKSKSPGSGRKTEPPKRLFIAESGDWNYAYGYKLAADALVERAAQGNLDLLFFPICFLYRHALEVTLKQCIRETEFLVRAAAKSGSSMVPDSAPKGRDEIDRRLERTHDIRALYSLLEERLRLIEKRSLWDEIGKAVDHWYALDPKGERVRFARRKGSRERSFTGQEFDVDETVSAAQTAFDALANRLGGHLNVLVDDAYNYYDE